MKQATWHASSNRTRLQLQCCCMVPLQVGLMTIVQWPPPRGVPPQHGELSTASTTQRKSREAASGPSRTTRVRASECAKQLPKRSQVGGKCAKRSHKQVVRSQVHAGKCTKESRKPAGEPSRTTRVCASECAKQLPRRSHVGGPCAKQSHKPGVQSQVHAGKRTEKYRRRQPASEVVPGESEQASVQNSCQG